MTNTACVKRVDSLTSVLHHALGMGTCYKVENSRRLACEVLGDFKSLACKLVEVHWICAEVISASNAFATRLYGTSYRVRVWGVRSASGVMCSG